MPFSPGRAKELIHARIRGDPEILQLLDLDEQSDNVDIAKRIIQRSQWDDLVNGERRICIYHRPSRPGSTDLFTENVLQIDVHVPSSVDYIADSIQERVSRLLSFKDPNNRTGKFEIDNMVLQLDGSLGELPTIPSFVCVGSRFCYYSTI